MLATTFMTGPPSVRATNLARFLNENVTGSAGLVDPWQEPGQQSRQGQEGTQPIDRFHVVTVGQPAQYGRRDAAQAEIEAVEQSPDQANAVGQKFHRIDQDRGE